MSTFLFEYEFAGETYYQTVEASDAAEAEVRVRAMATALYVGEMNERIPMKQAWRPKVVS